MNVFAREAFEGLNVEAKRAGVTRAKTVRVWHVGQSGRRMVMMLSPSRSGGSVTELSVTDRYRAGGDRASMEPSRSDSRSILLIVEKLTTRSAPQFPQDFAVRMPSLDRRWRLSEVEPELLVFC